MSDVSPCCRRPFSRVTVTTSGSSLTLASCTACGTHRWEGAGDGDVVDRSQMLDAMRSAGAALKGKRSPARA